MYIRILYKYSLQLNVIKIVYYFFLNTPFRYYDKILQALSVAISKEKHAGTLDNICGAIARMITTNAAAVPMHDVS